MGLRIADNMNLGRIKRDVDEVSPDALKAAADHVLSVSQEQAPLLVDVERANRHEAPGTLRDSGYAEVLDDDTAVVGYRDFIAKRQHEDLAYHHDIGNAKFLEIPMRTEVDEAMRIMAEKLREALGT